MSCTLALMLAQRRNRTGKKKGQEADALKEMLSEYALGIFKRQGRVGLLPKQTQC
jgi:hypothetical protein